MNLPETAPLPDFKGHTIFCDDIRQEADGKLIFIGVYSGSMLVRADFPATLPKFCFNILFYQRSEIFDPALSLRIFLPGDAEDSASIEADLEPIAEFKPSLVGGEYHMIGSNMMFAPFVINSPGIIKVRVLRQGVMHRIGSLSVQPHPTKVSNVSEPPSEQSQPDAPAS